jgi:hypothetical protein
MVPGLAVGDLCADCTRRLRVRAGRIARRVAMGTTLPLAVYVAWTLPHERTARISAAAVVVLWYVLTSLIVKRTAWEWLK